MNSVIFKRPLIIAHRGDTKAGLENTLPALSSAVALGVDGIEVDLRLTRDGRVVLFHDDNLLRLAERPETVEDLSLTDLQKVRLKGGFQIPTLDDLLNLAPEGILLNLELKVAKPFSGALERKTVETLTRSSRKAPLLLSSFHPTSLWRLRRLTPQTPRGYLFEKYWGLHRWIVPCLEPDSVNAPLSHISREFVDGQRGAGRRVFVWTVNGEEDMKNCIASEVDGIITDEPRKLRDLMSTV